MSQPQKLPAVAPRTPAPGRADRLFIGAFFALTLLPFCAQLCRVDGGGSDEKRVPAPAPAMPHSLAELVSLPARCDAYLNDHFGLRGAMVAASHRLRFALFGEVAAPQLTRGQHGSIYFNSHDAAAPMSMIRFLCGEGVTPSIIDGTSQRLARLIRQALLRNPNSDLLVIPTKSVVHPEDLPAEVARRCALRSPPLPAMVAGAKKDAGIAAHLHYPLDELRRLQAEIDVYPKQNFHWAGEGARRVVEYFVERTWSLKKQTVLPLHEQQVSSDIAHFLPGVPLRSAALLPDYAAAGIAVCEGPTCLPDLGAAGDKLQDLSRFQNPKAVALRLLIISDSFGHPAAGYFSQYFGEVRQLSTNNIGKLSPEERAAVQRAVYTTYAPDRVLYLYHDYAAPLLDDMAGKLVY